MVGTASANEKLGMAFANEKLGTAFAIAAEIYFSLFQKKVLTHKTT